MKKTTKKVTAKKTTRKRRTKAEIASVGSKSQEKRAEMVKRKEEEALINEHINPASSLKADPDAEFRLMEMKLQGCSYEMIQAELGDKAPTKKRFEEMEKFWMASPEEFNRFKAKMGNLIAYRAMEAAFKSIPDMSPRDLISMFKVSSDIQATASGMPSNITASVQLQVKTKEDLKNLIANDIPKAVKFAKKVENE